MIKSCVTVSGETVVQKKKKKKFVYFLACEKLFWDYLKNRVK